MIDKEKETGKPGKFPLLTALAVVLLAVLTLYALYTLSQFNYLLFHSAVEIFSLAIAFAIFAISWNSRRMVDNNYFLLVGIGFLFVGGLTLLHMLTYGGMDIFPGIGANWATQFWIAGRYILSLTLLTALFFSNRKIRHPSLALVAFAFVFSLIVASIMLWQVFPTAYIDGVGLTPFKVASEFVVSAILATAIVLLVKKRDQFSPGVFSYMVAAMAVIIAAEMSFTLYADVYGLLNVIGHLLTVIAFYLIYKALIEGSLSRPYDLLFRNLKQSQDSLTQQASELSKVNRKLEQEVLERKNVEEEVREQKEKAENYVDIAGNIIVALDTRGTITLLNRKAYEILGYKEGELQGKDWIETCVPSESRLEIHDFFDGLVQGKTKTPTDHENAIVTKSGERRIISWHNTELRDKKGQIIGTLSSGEDITRRKRLEEELDKYAKNLEKLVEERTKQLKDSERLAAIGTTAGMVGHDIRNPLQAIVSDLYLAKSDLAGMPEGEEKEGLRESLQEIEENVDYIDKIVQDLQDFAKHYKVSAKETDVKELCEEVLFKNDIPENIDASCEVEEKAKRLVVDPDLLKRILSNLVSNAVQAMPNGGKLKIQALGKESEIVISVQDTGVGIPEEVKPKLFTPLFTTKSKGQGFGLAVVKRMTEALGGTVSFDSEVGKGTKFIVRLPFQNGSKLALG